MSLKSPGNGNGAQTGSAASFTTATVTAATPTGATGGVQFGTTTTNTVAAGSGTALPATPQGYLSVNIGGTVYNIPYFPA
jgi:hypothetical protein